MQQRDARAEALRSSDHPQPQSPRAKSVAGSQGAGRFGLAHRRRRAQLALGRCLLLGACVLLSGCEDEKPAQTQPSALAAVDLTPIPAPKSLLADVFIATPESTWRDTRGLAGAGAALLPSSYPLLVTTLTGLPATAASSIDAELPVVGALIDVADAKPGLVLAVHLRSGRELIASVTKGADARFDAKLDASSQITELTPKSAGKSQPLGLGVLGNYLLVSTQREPLVEGGPYVVRSLSKQPAPKEPVVVIASKEALAGPIASRIRTAWKKRRDELQELDLSARKARGGRAPDFGDPAAALLGIESAIDDLISILQGSEQAKLIVRPGAAHLEAELEVQPKASGEAKKLIDELPVGKLARIQALPRDTSLVMLSHSTSEGRVAGAVATEQAFSKILDKRLTEADQKRLMDVLTALAKGRGDQLLMGFGRAAGSDEIALLMRVDASDAAEFNRGIRGARGLFDVKAFSEPLEQFVGGVKTKLGKAKTPGVTPAPDRIVFEILPKAPQARPGRPAPKVETKQFELVWRVQDGELRAAMAKDAAAPFMELAGLEEGKSLATHPELTKQLERAKLDVSFALMFQPGRVSQATARAPGADSPVLLVLGRRAGLGVVRLDVDQGALQSLARLSLR